MKLLLSTLLALPALAAAEIHYTLAPEPNHRSVRVSVRLHEAADRVAFRIPAWCPGFYVIQDYQEKMSDIRATGESGSALSIVRSRDPREWVVQNPSKKSFVFSYRIRGDDPGLGFFGVSVLSHTAFVNGPAAFVYADGRKEEAVRLTIKNPAGWETATSMEQADNGTFQARDYDELLDHPIRLGKFQRREFKVSGVPFEAVFVSSDNTFRPNLDEETKRLQALSLPAMRMFGGAPFKRYVYHVHLAIGSFSGGLEHQASTVLAVPNRRLLGVDDLATHEFFHIWNIKHIRPKVLGPFDYTREVRTGTLWFGEGVTDYYAKIHAYQSGLQDIDYLFDSFTYEIDSLQQGTTRKQKTAADASREAWEGGSMGTGDLSYYNKGLVIGLLLDAAIRSQTKGAKSLDDVLRYLFARHRLPDKPGYEEDGILKAINDVTGQDLTLLYNRMVNSTEELPYEVMRGIGMRVVQPGESFLSTGFSVKERTVASVSPAVAAQGLEVGDQLISLNDRPYTPGERVNLDTHGFSISARRQGRSVRLNLRPVRLTADRFIFERDPFASPDAAALGDAWLKRPEPVVQ